MNEVIDAINELDDVIVEHSIYQMISMIDYYDKSLTIIEEYDGCDCAGFKIFQEASSSSDKSSQGIFGKIKTLIQKLISTITGQSNKKLNNKRVSSMSSKHKKLMNETSDAKQEMVYNIINGSNGNLDYKKMKKAYVHSEIELSLAKHLVRSGVKIGSKILLGGSIFILFKSGLVKSTAKKAASKAGEFVSNTVKDSINESTQAAKNKASDLVQSAKDKVSDTVIDIGEGISKKANDLFEVSTKVVDKLEEKIGKPAGDAFEQAAAKYKAIQKNVDQIRQSIKNSYVTLKNKCLSKVGKFESIDENNIIKIDLEKKLLKTSFDLYKANDWINKCDGFIKNSLNFIGKKRELVEDDKGNKKLKLVNVTDPKTGKVIGGGDFMQAEKNRATSKDLIPNAFKSGAAGTANTDKKTLDKTFSEIFSKLKEYDDIDDFAKNIVSFRESINIMSKNTQTTLNQYNQINYDKIKNDQRREDLQLVYKHLTDISMQVSSFITLVDNVIKYVETVADLPDKIDKINGNLNKKDSSESNNKNNENEGV
jgi:hypothetical protein